MDAPPDLETIRRTVADLLEAEAARRAALEEALTAPDDGRGELVGRVEDLVEAEREMLAALDGQLAVERRRIEELEDAAADLQVDQAVRNRDAALRKLHRHNDHLQTFHDALSAAMDTISTNLQAIETASELERAPDPEPHLRAAREALEAHNETVEGLGKHLRILAQYML